jgi:hypothetical protein
MNTNKEKIVAKYERFLSNYVYTIDNQFKR